MDSSSEKHKKAFKSLILVVFLEYCTKLKYVFDIITWVIWSLSVLFPSKSFEVGPLLPTVIGGMFSEKSQVNTEGRKSTTWLVLCHSRGSRSDCPCENHNWHTEQPPPPKSVLILTLRGFDNKCEVNWLILGSLISMQ